MTDRRGNTTTYEYDRNNRLTKITDALGGETIYTYDALGQVTSITNAMDGVTSTVYDANGQVTTDANELAGEGTTHKIRYEYDSMGRVTKRYNEDGSSVRYEYDANGNITKLVNERGRAYTYTYDKNNLLLTETDPMGGTTTYTYTPDGELASETDALGGVVSYTYDENNNLIKMVDPEGYEYSYTYDRNNRPVTMTDANGNVTKYTYDANGNVTAIENPDGGVEQYVYDLNDQLISYTDGEGYTTTYVYDENGNLVKTTDPRGNSSTAEYDALNRQTVAVNEEGGRVELTYDALGRVTQAVNEDGAVTKYEYDAKGRVTAIQDAYGNYKRFEYDPMDRVTAVTDENGVRRTYEYDLKGNLTKYTDGLGNSETYAYDDNDNRIAVTNRNGQTYTYTYDALNRVTSETDPLGNTKTFTYDKNSRITAVTDRNGNTTEYVLDGNGNIVKSIDAAGTESEFTYDSMDRLTKVRLHRVDEVHDVDEWQETLYTYDYRGLVKTEVNAKGDGKVFVYDGNGNLIQKTDEDGYVTEYEYSPVNLVSSINYNDAKSVSYLYNGTGELVEMNDWNGTTSFSRDLLNRIIKVTDHDGRTVEYGWDAVGNKTVQGYPDGSQVDYYYDAENQIVEVADFDGGITKYEYDANGNKTFKEYPNYETAYYFYDACDQIIEMDEYDLGGKKLFKTTYSWDAEGNRLSEMQYNHGQSSGRSLLEAEELDTETETEKKGIIAGIGDLVQRLFNGEEVETPSAQLAKPDSESLGTDESIVNGVEVEEPAVRLGLGLSVLHEAEDAEDVYSSLMGQLSVAEEINDANTADAAETGDAVPSGENGAADNSTGDEDSNKPETGKDDAAIDGNGDGNGQVPPGQEEDEDGNIVNPGGNMPPGLNRGEKKEKPDNPNKPEKPENPGTEDSSDKQANKANKGTHLYGYDELNRMTSSNIANVETIYTYDTLGNLVLEETKNKVVDYQYNELNQLVSKKTGNESYTYTYDKRGNRIAETGKKESRTYVYDETNRMAEGTNWKGDKSSYIYNGLGIRINNTQTTHAGQVYSRDYVIDYTSYENDDLMVFAFDGEAVEYEQKQVYAGSERIEQFTDKGDWERILYVHEDIMGNTRYYTKANGQSYAELTYDAWGTPVSPNKLLNNDHGNFVYATFTGHIYDTTLDIYFAEARFYDAANRTWMAVDPVKDGLNWYQYCYSNPITYWDPLGLLTLNKFTPLEGSEMEPALFWHQDDFFTQNWWRDKDKLGEAYYYLMKESEQRGDMRLSYLTDLYNYYERYGMTNQRMVTLQRVLYVTAPTGVYDPLVSTTIQTALDYSDIEYQWDDPSLSVENLEALITYGEYVDTIGITGAIGGAYSAEAGGYVSGSVSLVADNKENASITGDISYGGGTFSLPGFSVFATFTDAIDIYALDAPTLQTGFSVTILGHTVGIDRLEITNMNGGDPYHGVSFSYSAGKSLLPVWFEFHSSI